MRAVDRLTVHEWTPPDDTALPKGTVEPNPRDATRDTLPHHFDGDLKMRGNHHSIHGDWNCGEVRTPHALDLRGGGIDGQSFVTRVAEFAENGICWPLCRRRPAMDRLERMLLSRVAREYFQVELGNPSDD